MQDNFGRAGNFVYVQITWPIEKKTFEIYHDIPITQWIMMLWYDFSKSKDFLNGPLPKLLCSSETSRGDHPIQIIKFIGGKSSVKHLVKISSFINF